LAGDAETGITIMQMEAGLDTGPMLMVQALPIAATDTTSLLHDRLAALGARMIVLAVEHLALGALTPTPQPAEGVTYAKKLEKDEGRIDWTQPATVIATMARGLNPWPGLWCEIGGQRLKVLEATATAGSGQPGTVIAPPLVVACGHGALSLDRVQRAGKAALDAADYLRGTPTPVGSRFDQGQI
jgi:methionyl-tRNA formyltransferase